MRYIYLILSIFSGFGLIITAVAVLVLFNPYVVMLSTEFSIQNQLVKAVRVTPLGALVMKNGEHRWYVLPQLSVLFMALPAIKSTRILVPPGETRKIRFNYDDISLAAFAVKVQDEAEELFIVDLNAAKGWCGYPPKQNIFVITESMQLMPLPANIAKMLDETELVISSRLNNYIVLLIVALLPPFGLWFFIRRYRSVSKRHHEK